MAGSTKVRLKVACFGFDFAALASLSMIISLTILTAPAEAFNFASTIAWIRQLPPSLNSGAETKFRESIASEQQEVVNGENMEPFGKLSNRTRTETTNTDTLKHLPDSPALSYQKYLTMQDKRVVVTVRYSGDAGLRPYFLTTAKKIKAAHPDVFLERRILPRSNTDDNGGPVFEIIVDRKVVVVGKSRSSPRTSEVAFFVSMAEVEAAIGRARRKNRPTTAYEIYNGPKWNRDKSQESVDNGL